jgi:hypothetical protein
MRGAADCCSGEARECARLGGARRRRGLLACLARPFDAYPGAFLAAPCCPLEGALELAFRSTFWAGAHERVRNSGGDAA